MNYKHSCVIDAQKLYKTFVLVMLVPTDDGAGVLDLGELGSASMTKLGQSDPALERAIGYIPGGLGNGATVYAGSTDDGRVLYYALSASGATAAIVLEDPQQDAVATYVGPRVYRDGAYHIVDDNDGGDITYTFTASGNVSAEIQHYTLQDGEQLVDTTPPTMRPYTGAEGLVMPRWDAAASAWVEGATEEEIADWETEHPAPELPERAPTPEERLTALEGAMLSMMGVNIDV